MIKIFISLLILVLSSKFFSKYESSYYKNTSNILDKYPKIDIDYIFSKTELDNNKNDQNKQNDQKDTSKNIQRNNPFSNIFQNIFYDYYQSSVPLYDEKMKCYFPMKKNISLDIQTNDENITKIKNISLFYGKSFIKSLKGRCERLYVERWYYTLCPLMGAMQTLSYIKSNENQKKDEEEKQEVNYLGYELKKNDYDNNTIFLKELYGNYKEFAEKKYYNEIMDIKEENLFNNYGPKNKIIGIYKNVVKFFGDNVFDSSKYSKYSKSFIIEYTKGKKLLSDKKFFKTNIIKIINNNIILINQTLEKEELIGITKVNKIKILNNFEDYPKNLRNFFNQSIFIYNDYLYSSAFNLIICINMNCHVTISNDKNIYKLDTIVDSKLAILEKGINNKKYFNLYEMENYCIFYGDDKLYFFGKGEIEELTEDTDSYTYFLVGQNLELKNSEEILLMFNDTKVEYTNYVFMNDIFNNKFLHFKYQERINITHFRVKLTNKDDIKFIEKEITLDGRYIIVQENKKDENKEEIIKDEAKYTIIGNEKNISLEQNSKENKEKIQIENPKEEYHYYRIPNQKEFVFNFDLHPYNYYSKDSFITLCFSSDKKCKSGEDYEMLIDIKNDALIMQKINDTNNNNNSLIYSVFKFKNIAKSSIIYINSTIYFDSVFKEENSLSESEIKLKYKIKNESYVMKYIIININKSKNIYIENMDFEDYVSFEYFKKIFLYEQKFLLDDKTIYVDTFENGDYCDPIKAPRRVIIYYTCDEEGIYELKLTKVFEDKKDICVYHFYAKSKYLCNPNMLMRNYIKSSGLKTFCYLDN